MITCPAGHASTATDYCDVCGLPLDVGAGATANPPTPADPAADTGADTGAVAAAGASSAVVGECPHCRAPNPVDALFCEACGYDFTTGTMPRGAESPAPPPSTPADPSVASVSPGGDQGNGSPAPVDTWVVEVWIDPDWYADQQSSDPLPSPGMPTVVALRHTSLLVGRRSRSRGIHPDLDLGSDPGISRRHAQLTTDGSRWFVEDLGSSNGTYVAPSVGPLPRDPVVAGRKQEVADDDRVYLGAWTRLVIRRAAAGEV